eukprot:1005241-Pyramimonas_sp.AAC.1
MSNKPQCPGGGCAFTNPAGAPPSKALLVIWNPGVRPKLAGADHTNTFCTELSSEGDRGGLDGTLVLAVKMRLGRSNRA